MYRAMIYLTVNLIKRIITETSL